MSNSDLAAVAVELKYLYVKICKTSKQVITLLFFQKGNKINFKKSDLSQLQIDQVCG